jgi:hypothetical protein
LSKEIVRRETRFAVHLPKTDYRDDTHYIKEQVFYNDGTQEPRCFFVKGFERPVWVTSKARQDHKDKKEFEYRDRLLERKCTQSDINRVVAGMLGEPHLANQPNELKSSPYIYGYDQTSTSLIKLQSLRKNNFIQSPYSVSSFDIETDMDTQEVIIATIVFENKAHVNVLTRFVQGFNKDVQERVDIAVEKYLPDNAKSLKVRVTLHDNEVDLLKAVFKTANEWGPDFLAIWNVNYDVKVILARLKLHNVNPVDVICDQSVPRSLRFCRYKEGITKKTTASGKHKPINPSLQWHVLTSTSRFYVIDAMCVYRQIRMAKQEEVNYKLDTILTKVLERGKLKFAEADGYQEGKWHTFMQANYPIEYIVYNIWDCLGMLELDAITKDLSQSFPSGAGMTDFAKYNSNPKKIVDALFLFGLERGQVVGTVGKVNKPEEESVVEALETDDIFDGDDDEIGEEDEKVERVEDFEGLGLKGWIQMLQQNLLMNEGLRVLSDFPNVVTNIRGLTWDVDATAAYPTATMVSNASKRTCVNEVINIEGIPPDVFKEQNLSVCLGGTNMLEYWSTMFGMPAIDEIADMLANE